MLVQAPSHGGHAGNRGNMATDTPSQRTEGVDPYAAGAHGDHLVQGLNHGGTGYAGGTAARGDNTAPTGSLPPGKLNHLVPVDYLFMSIVSHVNQQQLTPDELSAERHRTQFAFIRQREPAMGH